MSSRIHDAAAPASNRPKAKILNLIVRMFFVRKKYGGGGGAAPALPRENADGKISELGDDRYDIPGNDIHADLDAFLRIRQIAVVEFEFHLIDLGNVGGHGR